MNSTSMWIMRENFQFLKPSCTRWSLMTQFTNFDIEKNLQYIFTSNIMLVIHKWSRKCTNKHSIIKHVLKLSNDAILTVNFINWKLHYLYVTWHNDNKVIWNFFFTHITRFEARIEVKTIHSVLEFKQWQLLKPSVDLIHKQ